MNICWRGVSRPCMRVGGPPTPLPQLKEEFWSKHECLHREGGARVQIDLCGSVPTGRSPSTASDNANGGQTAVNPFGTRSADEFRLPRVWISCMQLLKSSPKGLHWVLDNANKQCMWKFWGDSVAIWRGYHLLKYCLYKHSRGAYSARYDKMLEGGLLCAWSIATWLV